MLRGDIFGSRLLAWLMFKSLTFQYKCPTFPFGSVGIQNWTNKTKSESGFKFKICVAEQALQLNLKTNVQCHQTK